jgi:hypothetical protein
MYSLEIKTNEVPMGCKKTIQQTFIKPINLLTACLFLLLASSCKKDTNNTSANKAPEDTLSFAQVPQSDIYEVTIISGNGTRQKQLVFQNSCALYQAGYMNMQTKDQGPLNLFKGRSISWTTFSFSGSVTVEVRLLNQNKVSLTNAVKILPSRYGIAPAIVGDVIRFTLTKPGQCSVEIGDEGYKNGLMIFANPAETHIPDTSSGAFRVLRNAKTADLSSLPSQYSGIYFRRGVHDIGVYHVPPQVKNIYFEEGSWIYGALIMDGNPNVKIYGRGVLSGANLDYRESHSIEAINQSDNIQLEGIVIADPKYFAVRLIGKYNIVNWVKVIGGWTYNCDGIAAFEGSKVSNCFIWANDDNIKVYRNNISFSDCVCWQLNNGGIIQLSWGNGSATDVTISRIDILHAEWNNDEVNRGVVSCVGDKFAEGGMYGLQKNWIIEDIVTETPVPLIFRISPNAASPNEIHGMVFKNWNVKMDLSKGFSNYIIAADPLHKFDGVVFDHVVFNGTQLSSSNWISAGRFVIENVDTPLFY